MSNLRIATRQPGRAARLVPAAILCCGAALLLPAAPASAQPSVRDVATVLADPDRRGDALYRVIALARHVEQARTTGSPPAPEAVADDIGWLDHLRARHGEAAARSPALDPAAWRSALDLRQLGMQPDSLISPLGPGLAAYLRQVFDRSDERLARALLPELAWSLEPEATTVWAEWLDTAEPAFAWMEAWAGADPGMEVPEDLFGRAVAALDAMLSSAIGEGPPDRNRLSEARYLLLAAMPGLERGQRDSAAAYYRLAGMLDGLHEGRYFAFAEGLLALAAGWLPAEAAEPPDGAHPAAWLEANLPAVSARFARDFASVDPQLNSVLAASLDVARSLGRPAGAGEPATLHRELGNAAAQLALLIPDLDYYFGLPVRDTIAGGVDACTGIIARRESDGSPAMTRELFDDCQQSLVEMADGEARGAALAGDPDGPFGEEELRRELTITSGQRINYGIGYLHERYATGCAAPAHPLPNPLEWATLATLMAWFAGQSPVYFQAPGNEARLERMRGIGAELSRVLSEQVDCFAGSGASVSDPVSRSLAEYREAVVALGNGIGRAISEFRSGLLAEGADIALERDAGQSTAYRPENLAIGPCNPDNTCEMSGTLSATRALLGLFPDPYLVGDQSGHGRVEICYDGVSWVSRRSEPVRTDDANVANYYGQLQFELHGRYRAGDRVDDIFGFRFQSPDEHHYLFAVASDEVLADACPLEWIGQRIVTPLRSDRGGIVPNRLTYLAAPRMLPSRLLSANWQRGAEWRDWFITGIGVEPLQLEAPPGIDASLNRHLANLHRAEQAAVYRSLLQPESRSDIVAVGSLYEEAIRVTAFKALIRHQLMVFYPQVLVESDALRQGFAGQGGLLDSATLLRFRNENVPVNVLNALALERLALVEETWSRQPESLRRLGSIAGGVARAMLRLNAVRERYFAEPPPPVTEPVSG